MKSKKLNAEGKDYKLEIHNYTDNGRLAILIYNDNDELFSDLTINLSDMMLPEENCAFINSGITDTKIGSAIYDALRKEEVIDYDYGMYQYNLGKYKLVSFDIEKLKEYDLKGSKKYLEEKENYKEL